MKTSIAVRKRQTFQDLLHDLGDISPSRVRVHPYPATEEDVLAIYDKERRRCELVDGVLVEKLMSLKGSWLATALSAHLFGFVYSRNLGLMGGEAGMLGISFGLIRIPDVSFISWSRIHEGKVPDEPVPKIAPDLAVEVLSESNTPAEMKRKCREYFNAGVSLVWIIDPDARTVVVYSSLKKSTKLTESDVLDGSDVLPGFTLSLSELFAVLDREAPK